MEQTATQAALIDFLFFFLFFFFLSYLACHFVLDLILGSSVAFNLILQPPLAEAEKAKLLFLLLFTDTMDKVEDSPDLFGKFHTTRTCCSHNQNRTSTHLYIFHLLSF